MTEAIRRQIVERYEAGQSCRTIGEALFVSHSTVLGVLHREGVPVRKGGWKRTRKTNVRLEHRRVYVVAQLYEAGWSMREIPETLGVSIGCVHARLRRAEVMSRPRGPLPVRSSPPS